MNNLKQLAQEVGPIARAAGAAILEIYNSNMDFGVEAKADDSPLTIADKAANKVIVAGLEALDYQAPIISEENKLVDYATRTKEFIKRNGEFTVNIALVEGNSVVVGVVYVPVSDELFYAAKGHGAFRIAEGKEEKLEAATYSLQDEGLKIVASRSHRNQETNDFIAELNTPELVSKGSSLKLLLVASGQAHIYPRLAPTMEWDTAAAQIVVEEAGGTVLQAGTESPVVYNKENLLNPHFVVYGKVK